eukprot:3515768-Prymnesium_polylepis.1
MGSARECVCECGGRAACRRHVRATLDSRAAPPVWFCRAAAAAEQREKELTGRIKTAEGVIDSLKEQLEAALLDTKRQVAAAHAEEQVRRCHLPH